MSTASRKLHRTSELGDEEKECCKCKCWKPLTEFNKDKTWDGLDRKCKECGRKYRQEHRERMLEQKKKYRKDKKIERGILAEELPKRDEIDFRLIHNISSHITSALKGIPRAAGTMKLLGCKVEELWIHLEKKFGEGMTKQNYGEWRVDHIVPCEVFDFSNTDEQFLCFNYRNLQPLWKSKIYRRKRITKETQTRLDELLEFVDEILPDEPEMDALDKKLLDDVRRLFERDIISQGLDINKVLKV